MIHSNLTEKYASASSLSPFKVFTACVIRVWTDVVLNCNLTGRQRQNHMAVIPVISNCFLFRETSCGSWETMNR